MNCLPKVRIKDVIYYIDEKLGQLRNINNPHDFIGMSALDMCYLINQHYLGNKDIKILNN